MWRIGHNYTEKKTNNSKKLPAISKQTKTASYRRDHQSPAVQSKPSRFGKQMIDPRTRRGSITATEHLLRRRSSRVERDDVHFDHAKQLQNSRRFSSATKMGKFREIQDRIKKVMKEYDSPPHGENYEEKNMIEEIEEGLVNVEDDMMRINISALINRYKMLQRYRNEAKNDFDLSKVTSHQDEHNEVLQSLQDWLDKDHFDSDEPEPPTLELLDKEVISAEILEVSEKIKNLSSLKGRICDLKTKGNDTYHLELRQEYLHDQMKNEVRRLQERKSSENNREFHYIKNASAEIYDLIRRTKLEGMAHSSQFEDQLKKILTDMDATKEELNSLQDLVRSQKDTINKWSKDYELLQNELLFTSDERNIARRETTKAKQELLEYMQRAVKLEKSLEKGDILRKADHEAIAADLESNLKSAKQNLIILRKTIGDKDSKITELNQQIFRLKNSLRKNSSMSFNSEISFHHTSASDVGNRPQCHGKFYQDSSKSFFSSTDSIPHLDSDAIISSLKEEVEILRDKLDKELIRKHLISDDDKESGEGMMTQQKNLRNLVSQETQTSNSSLIHLKKTKIAVRDALSASRLLARCVACQTSSPAALGFMSPFERKELMRMCQMLNDKIGTDWIEVATKFSALEKVDVMELSKAFLAEDDIQRINFGSSTKTPCQEDAEQQDYLVEKQLDEVMKQVLHKARPENIEIHELESVTDTHSQPEAMTNNTSKDFASLKSSLNKQADLRLEANERKKQNIPQGGSQIKAAKNRESGPKQNIPLERSQIKADKNQVSDHSSGMLGNSKERREIDSAKTVSEVKYTEERRGNLSREMNQSYTSEMDQQLAANRNFYPIASNYDQMEEFQFTGATPRRKMRKMKVNPHAAKEANKKRPDIHAPVILSSLPHTPLRSQMTPCDGFRDINDVITPTNTLLARLWHSSSAGSDDHTIINHTDFSKLKSVGPLRDKMRHRDGVEKTQTNDIITIRGTVQTPRGKMRKCRRLGKTTKTAVQSKVNRLATQESSLNVSRNESWPKSNLLGMHYNLYDARHQRIGKINGTQDKVNLDSQNSKSFSVSTPKRKSQYPTGSILPYIVGTK